MNYTYMVKCADGTLYTGWTNCVEKRLKAHNEGKAGAKYTRAKRPVELVYYEGYATKEEAMRREYAIKQLTRKEKLKLMEFCEYICKCTGSAKIKFFRRYIDGMAGRR